MMHNQTSPPISAGSTTNAVGQLRSSTGVCVFVFMMPVPGARSANRPSALCNYRSRFCARRKLFRQTQIVDDLGATRCGVEAIEVNAGHALIEQAATDV